MVRFSAQLSKGEKEGILKESELGNLTDPVPAELLCQYFVDNLSLDDYLTIECWTHFDEEKSKYYHVLICAEDINPFKDLLDSYDGPWTPINFQNVPYSLNDLIEAESEFNSFLEEHPEIPYAYANRDGSIIEIRATEVTAELRSFVDNYPIQQLFFLGSMEES